MSAPYAGGSPTEGPSGGEPGGNWLDSTNVPVDASGPSQNPHPRDASGTGTGTGTGAGSAFSRSNTDDSNIAPDRYAQYNPVPRDSGDADRSRQQSYATEKLSAKDLPSTLVAGGDRSKPSQNMNGSRRPSGSRICAKCGEPLYGQFVRALDNTYHLECFTCHECGKIVASKFFPVPEEGPDQYPLCETDYFRRLDLLCFACGGALRASYITALDRKYHIEHFTCSVCPTVFGAQDSYYEHEGNVYCHYHYSTRFAQRCQGCQNAILKQFVEIFRNGQNQHWHPECYMIHKYWNVRLHNPDKGAPTLPENETPAQDATDEVRQAVRADEERVEEKVLWIWRTLSAFEERSAQCISDMLVNVSNGAYMEGIVAARKFIVHVELFFECTDDLDRLLFRTTGKGLSSSREAKLLCKKVVAFFQLLSQSQNAGMQRLGVTQELLSLVTGLAHYLKLLIRICLQGSLKLERESGNYDGLKRFLDRINTLDDRLDADEGVDSAADSAKYVRRTADVCPVCDKPVEEKCAKKGDRVFHLQQCMACKSCGVDLGENVADARWSASQQAVICRNCGMRFADADGGFETVTRSQQYVHLLKVAHARLLASLRTSGSLPHTSDDPNLFGYDSNQGHRLAAAGGDGNPPLLRTDTRSKSFTAGPQDKRASTSYDQTLSDIRRLRSTRIDRHLSNSMKRARASRVIEGPGGISISDTQGAAADGGKRSSLQIVQDRDMNGESQMGFSTQSMALDDIPRLAAVEQAREQRPNASKYARGNLIGSEPRAKLVNGHRRDYSGGRELEQASAGDSPPYRQRKYFSELSALEYFIVRHIAVLSMEPLLEGHFNQQELLDLIENKRPTFWDRFGKAFKNDKGAGKKRGCFGRSLELVVDRDGADSTDGVGPGALRIPAVVDSAVSAMRNMDMSVEGVFRKNGNIRRLKDMAEEIDTKGSDTVDLARETPIQVAALLKKFLRELPDPVLTHKLYKLWITGAKISDDDRRRRVLHLTCCLLPKVHRDTMEVLFTFLNWAASFHTVDEESGSKMDIHNLATVIAPNILYSNNKNPEVDSSLLAIEAIYNLIECNESMCEVPEDLLSILSDTSLFENSAELTTKEILKRWGEIGRAPQATLVASPGPGSGGPRSREGWTAVTQVTQDPQAWQNESSVRHVGPGNMTYAPSSNSMGAPQPLQYQQQNDIQGSPNRHSQFRSSQLHKQGPLGITGAG